MGATDHYSRLLPALVLSTLVASGGCGPAQNESPSVDAPSTPSLHFTDVTAGAGLGSFTYETGAVGDMWYPESMGSGCGFVDFDDDGWPDIVLVSGGLWPGSGKEAPPVLRLYRNNRDGTFADVTRRSGFDRYPALGEDGYGYGLAAADYDRDGDIDLYVTTVGHNLLFRNDGGVFTDVAAAAGADGGDAWGASSAFFDADRDGWMDLFIANYVEWSPGSDLPCTLDGATRDYCTPHTYPGEASRFLHNNGDGTFSDHTLIAGFTPPQKSLGVVVLDYDRDGWTDLVVANDGLPDHLYRNRGDGTFEELGLGSGIAYDDRGRARAGMGIDAGVVDTTGFESVFIANFSGESIGVYRYGAAGMFEERSAASLIGAPSLWTLAFGLVVFDADLDGNLDVFAANGHLQTNIERNTDHVKYAQPPHLFLNAGDGTFSDAAPKMGAPLSQPLVARGASAGDYDGDGDLDLLVVEGRADGRVHLWRNEVRNQNENRARPNYLRVRVLTPEGGPAAVGTTVSMTAGGKRQYRYLRTSSGYLSLVEPVLTFGLGDHTTVDTLTVKWQNGVMQQYVDVKANADLVVPAGTEVP